MRKNIPHLSLSLGYLSIAFSNFSANFIIPRILLLIFCHIYSCQQFFSHSVGCLFSQLTVSFSIQIYSFMRSQYQSLTLFSEKMESDIGNPSMCLSFIAYSLCFLVIVSVFTLRCLIHLELSFTQDEK